MSRTPMIAVVDDDQVVRRGIENQLLSLGYDVVTFASAGAFLVSKQADATACLISDVKMPAMSGLDLQQRLIADGKHLPIIFITAFPSESVRAQALAAGAVGFLRKPCHDGDLIEYINKALNQGASVGDRQQTTR